MVLMTTTLSGFAQGDKEKLSERLTAAQAVMNEIMATPDKGIPRGILAGAIPQERSSQLSSMPPRSP